MWPCRVGVHCACVMARMCMRVTLRLHNGPQNAVRMHNMDLSLHRLMYVFPAAPWHGRLKNIHEYMLEALWHLYYTIIETSLFPTNMKTAKHFPFTQHKK